MIQIVGVEMEWKDIKKEKPPQNVHILVKLEDGGVYRGKYLYVTFVEKVPSDYIGNNYRLFGEPFEVFIPYTKEFTPSFREIMQNVTHWIEFKE